MCDVCLHGLANMMSLGETPISSRRLISPLLAQSKPVPRCDNKESKTGSSLHLTARERGGEE